jgi:creatinine amidohydrolase
MMDFLTDARALASLTWKEAAARVTPDSILLQPLGSIEQHGPHLPLATDQLIANAVAGAVVAEFGERDDVWVLPPLVYTKSDEHAWAPGTVWLSAPTLHAVLDDIGRSATTLAARKLVLLNGHGGNSALLQVACRELRLAHGIQTFLTHPYVAADQGGPSPADELGMGIHGGIDETSLLLHISPQLVHMDLAERSVPESIAGRRHVRFGGPVTFGWSAADLSEGGAIGDPTGATPERGKQLFEAAVAFLGEAFEEIAAFELPRFRP